MNLTVKEIAQIIGAPADDLRNPQNVVTNVLTDSRSVAFPANSVFFALQTESSDGHRYIGDLLRAGVSTFVVEKISPQFSDVADTDFLVVPSTEAALLSLGAAVRAGSKATIVGITGSRGKTQIKEWLYTALISANVATVRSPRSWNSHIGVPLALCELPQTPCVALIETGIDAAGQMQKLAEAVRPEIGVMTEITDEHNDGFASIESKIAEKALLFHTCRAIIYIDSHPVVADTLRSLCPDAELIPVPDLQSAATATLRVLGHPDVVPECVPVSTRIDVHEAINDCLIAYDGFTADLRSLQSALDFMRRRLTPGRGLTAILSDLIHSPGTDISALYNEAASLLKAFGVTRLIAIGPEFKADADVLDPLMETEFVPTPASFLDSYDINRFSSELILIKGKPSAEFQQIKALLENPRHATIFEVNLDAVIHNFNYFRSKLSPGTGLVAMVKASAYGAGAPEIAKTLQSQGASYLAVAVVDEGVELRRSGVTMPIMVLNPITNNYRALFDYKLEPSVFSLREFDLLNFEALRYDVSECPVHIKLDTGMHRVGFIQPELPALIQKLQSPSPLRVASIFSHLATADCLDQDEYTNLQLDNFAAMSQQIINALPYSVKRHVLNTAGIMRYPAHQYDMVRLGIGLYGVSPIARDAALQPVGTLKSTIISLKNWDPGITIGYGRRGIVTRPSVIATVAIGYADGVNRHLGRGNASFKVRGVDCPTIGNICMDQCMIDVTNVPGVSIGDEVIIFGPEAPVETLAEKLDTIPYELLTSVSPRVKRIYFRE